MRIFVIGLILNFIAFAFSSGLKAQENVNGDYKILDLNGFTNYFEDTSDTIHILNLWATWCGPCVKELPSFDSLYLENNNPLLKISLISIDFDDQLETKLRPFIIKRKVKSEVLAFPNTRYNDWLPLIDKDWQGDIPVTLLYRGSDKKRIFHAGSLDLAELKHLLLNFD